MNEHNAVIDLLWGVAAVGFLPFLAVGVTSFVKFSTVLVLLRNALGTQQIPSVLVLNSLAIILSVFVMLPIGVEVAKAVESAQQDNRPIATETQNIVKPLLNFAKAHAKPEDIAEFKSIAHRLWGDKLANEIVGEKATPFAELIVVMPAFMISELTKAFLIGFLLYLPFLVVDLLVANILLALGMSTMSPVTVSLPIKLLLFIGLDGWRRLLEALAGSYV